MIGSGDRRNSSYSPGKDRLKSRDRRQQLRQPVVAHDHDHEHAKLDAWTTRLRGLAYTENRFAINDPDCLRRSAVRPTLGVIVAFVAMMALVLGLRLGLG